MKDKNYTISVIRMISMLMIISCHVLQGLGNRWAFWINVGVQIFLFISGFLYGNKEIDNIKEFYNQRLKKILFPYSIIFIIALCLSTIILKKQYDFKFIIAGLLGFTSFKGRIPIISHTWFISYILLCYLLVPLLYKIFNTDNFRKNTIRFILLTLFINLLEEFSVMNVKACWINTFILGYFYKKCLDNKKSKTIYEISVFALFILIIPFAYIYQEKIVMTLPKILDNNSTLITNYGHVFLGTVIFIVLYKIFNKIKIRKSFILNFSDKYSYHIYLVHQIFILHAFSLLHLTNYLIVNILIILVCSILSGVLLKFISDLLMKLFENAYNKLHEKIITR